MKNLFITYNGAVSFDTETQDANTVIADRTGIRNVYLIDEDTRVVYTQGTTKQEIYAQAGDILIAFYNDEDFNNKIVVAKSAQWADNIKAHRAAEQKRKEEWAAKRAESVEETDMPTLCAA